MSRQWECEVECFSSLKMGTLILWAGRVGVVVSVVPEDTIQRANSCGKVYTKVSLKVSLCSITGRSPFCLIVL